MDPLITATLIAWVVIRCWEALKAEWRHTRDRHIAGLAREHADWSPGRIRRHARYRARAYWWNEIGAGFPTWKAGWTENRLVARLALERTLTEGHKRIKDVKQAIADVQAERKAAAEDDPAPVRPEPGTGTKPALTVLPGGREPVKGTVPEPPEPEPPAALEGPAEPGHLEPAAPEPSPGTGDDAPAGPRDEPAPVTPWTVQEDELLGSGRCIQRTGAGEEGPTYCAMPVVPGEIHCPAHDGAPPPDGSTEEAPGVLLGAPPTNGGQVTTPAVTDTETGDTPFDAMLTTHRQHAKQQRQIAQAANDDLMAHAIARGFDRDPAYMADLQAVADAAEAAATAAEGAVRGLNARHADGAEYHGTGHDADAGAFRPA